MLVLSLYYLLHSTVGFVQALGDELGEILENQRQLEEQLDGLLQDGGKGNGRRVSRSAQENVHSITAAAHGRLTGVDCSTKQYPFINSCTSLQNCD